MQDRTDCAWVKNTPMIHQQFTGLVLSNIGRYMRIYVPCMYMHILVYTLISMYIHACIYILKERSVSRMRSRRIKGNGWRRSVQEDEEEPGEEGAWEEEDAGGGLEQQPC